MTLPRILARCFLIALACTATTLAADWPHWGGTDGGNMVSDAKDLPADFVPGQKTANGIDMATTKHVKWAVPLGSAAYGNPTVANGRVFVGTDDASATDDKRFDRTRGGMVKCFDDATGKLLWQLLVRERKDYRRDFLFGQQHLGTCSSPCVDGDRVYVVTSDASVLCLDVNGQANGNDGPFMDEGQYMAGPGKPPIKLCDKDADIIWRLDLINDVGIAPHDITSCSILVDGDYLYLSSSNGVDKPHETVLRPEAPAFIAVDKRTGKVVARDGDHLSRRIWHCQWSSPSKGVVNGKTLIFVGGADGRCYAYEAIGQKSEVRDQKSEVRDRKSEVRDQKSEVRDQKSEVRDRKSEVRDQKSEVRDQKSEVGSQNLTSDLRPLTSELKIAWVCDCNPPEYRYGPDGKPRHYMAGDKRKKFSTNKNDGLYIGPSDIIATPVFCNNRVYVALGQDPAHGRGKGMFTCIDATKTGDITKTGKIWTYDGMDRTIATAAVSDGLVYITDIAGRIHCLDADTGKPHWVYETKSEIWGSPLVADGKIYFGTVKNLMVMAAGKEAKVLSQINLGSPVYSSPIVANGVLYVASQRYLWAVR